MSFWKNLTKDRIYNKFITEFTPEEQESMIRVNNENRYMRNSGIYEDHNETIKRQKHVHEIQKIENSLSDKAKEWLQYIHWRSWNRDTHPYYKKDNNVL